MVSRGITLSVNIAFGSCLLLLYSVYLNQWQSFSRQFLSMYRLMIKFDSAIVRLLQRHGAFFLLAFYDRYVPERIDIYRLVCFPAPFSFRFSVLLGHYGTRICMKTAIISRAGAVCNAFSFFVAAVLKATIGSSSNYFKSSFLRDRFQSNPFFSPYIISG